MYSGGLRFALGDDIEALRESVRRFASERIAPQAADIDRTNSFPMPLWREMANSACSASRRQKSMAAPASVISPIASPWRKSAAPPRPLP